jgi:hypothetical protein
MEEVTWLRVRKTKNDKTDTTSIVLILTSRNNRCCWRIRYVRFRETQPCGADTPVRCLDLAFDSAFDLAFDFAFDFAFDLALHLIPRQSREARTTVEERRLSSLSAA